MKNMKHPLENPASSRHGKCRPGCSDRVRGNNETRADGCGAGAGRVATMGRAPRDDGSDPCDDGLSARDDGSALPDDGSAARYDRSALPDDGSAARYDGSALPDDGYGS